MLCFISNFSNLAYKKQNKVDVGERLNRFSYSKRPIGRVLRISYKIYKFAFIFPYLHLAFNDKN